MCPRICLGTGAFHNLFINDLETFIRDLEMTTRHQWPSAVRGHQWALDIDRVMQQDNQVGGQHQTISSEDQKRL